MVPNSHHRKGCMKLHLPNCCSILVDSLYIADFPYHNTYLQNMGHIAFINQGHILMGMHQYTPSNHYLHIRFLNILCSCRFE